MAVQSELLFQRVPLSIRNMRADVYLHTLTHSHSHTHTLTHPYTHTPTHMRADVYLLSPFGFLLLLLYSRYRSE